MYFEIFPIDSGLLFIGRYELPLRGHKDYGGLTLEEPEHNDGIFRAILRLIGNAGDPGVKA